MNKRIMKKKYNKWCEHNDDQVIDLGYQVSTAAKAKGITPLIPIINEQTGQVECLQYTVEYMKFARSKDVMRAVKSYAKKYVYHTGKCDNIRQMYRYMCEQIREERIYQKRIIEQITAEEVREASEEWSRLESVRSAFGL